MIKLKKIKQFFVLTGILAVLSIAFLSVNMASAVTDENHGMLPDCPYAIGESSMCPMDLVDHMAIFKQTFTALNASGLGIYLVLLFLPFALALLRKIPILEFSLIETLRRFENKNSHFQLFDWLKFVLARGIMQPKLYNLALV